MHCEARGESESAPLAEPLALAAGEREQLGEGLTVSVCESLPQALGEGLPEGVSNAVREALPQREAVGDRLALPQHEGLPLGLPEALGVVALALGLR